MSRVKINVLGHKQQQQKLTTILQADRVPVGLIFVGPSGIGKSKVALQFTQDLLCPNGVVACGDCGSCTRVHNEQSEALKIIQPATSQIKIDQVREIIRFINLKSEAKHRVVLIKQAHLLNPQSSNALLKSIEEPPPGVHFILVADSLMRILPTIRSRSQVMKFSPLDNQSLTQLTGASGWVLEAAQGRVEQAEYLMNEEVNSIRQRAIEFMTRLLNQDTSPLEFIKNIESEIKDRKNCMLLVHFWQQFVRDTYVKKLGHENILHKDYEGSVSQFSSLSLEALEQLSEASSQLESDVNANVDKMLSVETFSLNAYNTIHGVECV